MYYVNREQIDQRLQVIPVLIRVLGKASEGHAADPEVSRFAAERALHLAVEVVTDVGSCLIDGFIMRDASSYEDIVEIIHDERVIDDELHAVLLRLVRLRKPLVQDYFGAQIDLQAAFRDLPAALTRFAERVELFIEHELAR